MTPVEIAVAVVVVGVALVGYFNDLLEVAFALLAGGGLLLYAMRRRRRDLMLVAGLVIAGPVLMYLVGWGLLLVLITRQEAIPQNEWPPALSQIASDTNAPANRVEAVSTGGFVDTTNVWRMPMDEQDLVIVARDLDAAEIDESKVPQGFWTAFPGDMQPTKSAGSRYFMSQGFPVDERGDDGDHHLAMYDSRARVLYVWEVSNF